MKRGVVLIFLLLTTMMFGEDSQIDEVLGLKNEIKKLQTENTELKELEKRFIKLEATMNGIEKERMSSVDYHEKALKDSKDIFDKSLSHIYWFVGIIITLVGIAIAILQIVLRWDSRKKLAKEKEEIEEMKRATLDELNKQKNYIDALEENLKRDVEKANNELKIKVKEVDEKLEKIDKQTAEVQQNYQKSKIDIGISQALQKETDQNKYDELKKIEKEVGEFDERLKGDLYYFIAKASNDLNIEINYYKKLIKTSPKAAFYYKYIGENYIKLNQKEEALENFKNYLELNKKENFEVKVNKGEYDRFINFTKCKVCKTQLDLEVLEYIKQKEE